MKLNFKIGLLIMASLTLILNVVAFYMLYTTGTIIVDNILLLYVYNIVVMLILVLTVWYYVD